MSARVNPGSSAILHDKDGEGIQREVYKVIRDMEGDKGEVKWGGCVEAIEWGIDKVVEDEQEGGVDKEVWGERPGIEPSTSKE